MTQAFYDGLAPYYHLLYPNWEASIARQSAGLERLLTEFGVPPGSALLDAACGIGTQALGLAQRGYDVTASDLSPSAVARAQREAEERGLRMTFAVADLRELGHTFATRFPAVIACDNAIPHLLTDDDIRRAFAACRAVLAPGGVLLVSVRDYAAIERRTPDVHSYGTRVVDGRTYGAEQVWEWAGDQYSLILRLTEEAPGAEPIVREFHSRYYAIELPALERLLREAGFGFVARRDEHFFQPLLVAVNAPGS